MIGDPSGKYRYEKDDDNGDRFEHNCRVLQEADEHVSLISQMARHYLLIMQTGLLNLNYIDVLQRGWTAF